MKVFLIVLTICAIVFAIYESVMFIIWIKNKVAQKRQNKKVDNKEKLSGDDTARKE